MATLVIRERQQAEAERAGAIQAALTSRAAEAASSASSSAAPKESARAHRRQPLAITDASAGRPSARPAATPPSTHAAARPANGSSAADLAEVALAD